MDIPSPKPLALVVDDDEESRAMMQHLLGQAGMAVRAVESAEHALLVACSETPAIVLTDLSLGGGVRDGVWLLTRLRQAVSPMPVIAVTRRRERVDELLDMGFAAVLIRPAIPDDLVAIVRDAISRSS